MSVGQANALDARFFVAVRTASIACNKDCPERPPRQGGELVESD
ncbi:MAG: Ada metal-binding domain-containing protein [Porticoccaceae bacterium]